MEEAAAVVSGTRRGRATTGRAEATPQHARRVRIRRWLVGYVALLFGMLPFALPLWEGVLRDVVGGVVTIEWVHLVQYAGLGWLGGLYAAAGSGGVRAVAAVTLFLLGVGVLDEVVQRWLPGRFFEWSDVGLNLAGAALGLALSLSWTWLSAARGRLQPTRGPKDA